ncbi:MAG TPA: hypothetical protein VFG37_15195 [Planctomycetota bacterium]|nr:hypothetical protein [Planctomycetota bacterium]
MIPTSKTAPLAAASLALVVATLLAQEKPPAPAAPPAQTKAELPPPLKAKVLQLVFDPPIASEGGKRLHEVMEWSDPEQNSKQYAADLEEASGGYADYQIVESLHVDEFPLLHDGFRYDFATLRDVLQGKTKPHQPEGFGYLALLDRFKVAERVEKGEIDEVWLQAMPYAGCYESTMAGDGAYDCNSGPLESVKCKRLFVVMGFNYERGVGEMLEDYGHRTEAILTHVFGSWDPPKKAHAWDRFTLYDLLAPGEAACGNVHFAPNSTRDYEWGNETPVASTCDDWLAYPDLKGTKRTVTCAEWGDGDMRLHHKWWLAHLPRAAGRSDGKLNHWWAYAADFNRWPESGGHGAAPAAK